MATLNRQTSFKPKGGRSLANGKTLAVVTLRADQIRQIAKDEIAHARHVVVAA